MKKLSIYLVKPFPCNEIREGKCPTKEAYKYAWEPLVLKYLAHHLIKAFDKNVSIKIWHLINENDQKDFLSEIKNHNPDIVAFTEIDVLVNSVNLLARKIKEISKKTVTLCGGKQSSLLRKGDLNPFHNIDYIIRGDGVNGIVSFVQGIMHNEELNFDGLINGQDAIISGENAFCSRTECLDIDFNQMVQLIVQNHDYEEYLQDYQFHPSIQRDNVRTAPLLTGNGCPYQCFFCQSPIEYNNGKTILNSVHKVAKHIFWLNKTFGVNNFFALEPNLNLSNLLSIYEELEQHGIHTMPISGFIRAADILTAHKHGYLNTLVNKGVRILSIGLDVPSSMDDVYNKSFTFTEMMKCLDICFEYGIIVLATFVGDPILTQQQFEMQLEKLKPLKVADIDIRLAIALRNTEFYNKYKENLIYHPDNDAQYYDRQNYRYQTLQFADKIKPEETYSLVNNFNETFLSSKQHLEYVKNFTEKHPLTIPFFLNQYGVDDLDKT